MGIRGLIICVLANFVPCEWKQCYLCMHGHASVVAYAGLKRAAEVLYKCNTRVKTEECSTERVDLGIGNYYCRMCYRLQQDGTIMEKRKQSNNSRMGCVICRERVCAKCWESGYDKHRPTRP